MQNFTLDTDFSELSGKDAHKIMLDFTQIVSNAFGNGENQTLLGNLLVMSRYINTVHTYMSSNGDEISPGILKAYNILWDCLEGKISAADYEAFANYLLGVMSNYNTGSDYDVPDEFYDEYFKGDFDPGALEINLLEWCVYLLVPLVVKDGGHIDYFEGEDEDMGGIDFFGLNQIMDVTLDMCVELTDTPVPSSKASDLEKVYEKVYKTPLFTGIIKNIQNDLKTALAADPSKYSDLRNKYRSLSIMPEEYALKIY